MNNEKFRRRTSLEFARLNALQDKIDELLSVSHMLNVQAKLADSATDKMKREPPQEFTNLRDDSISKQDDSRSIINILTSE